MNPHPATLDPTVRRSIEDEIERLISLLDEVSPDPDLEPDLDDEPGTWTEFQQSRGHSPVDDENLEEGEADEDGGDTELNGDELDYNGDEGDYSGHEGEMGFSGESDPTARPAAKEALRQLRTITTETKLWPRP